MHESGPILRSTVFTTKVLQFIYTYPIMTPLELIIASKIRNEGPISFEAFMEMALYYPDLGYYASPRKVIGREGDFYTSPHLHPAFGAVLGRQLREMWAALGKPAVFHAVEMGAGMGYLCKDILGYLCMPLENNPEREEQKSFLRSLRYIIIEPFTHFEQQQRKLLELHREHPLPSISTTVGKGECRKTGTGGDMKVSNLVRWVKSLDELEDITGCILSNELLDAFPVHLVEMDDTLKEVYISLGGETFREVLGTISTGAITQYITHYATELPRGYRTEINLRIKDWLGNSARALSSGFLLTIDYGYTAREYYSEDRSKGTLLCYHKHLFNEDPCRLAGEQDITAHVNFSSLKQWGEELGLKTLGYCGQGIYLIASGIDEVIAELYSGTSDYLAEVSKIKGLIMPQGMGESHRVMIQYKGDGMPELRGFSMKNLAGNL